MFSWAILAKLGFPGFAPDKSLYLTKLQRNLTNPYLTLGPILFGSGYKNVQKKHTSISLELILKSPGRSTARMSTYHYHRRIFIIFALCNCDNGVAKEVVKIQRRLGRVFVSVLFYFVKFCDILMIIIYLSEQ